MLLVIGQGNGWADYAKDDSRASEASGPSDTGVEARSARHPDDNESGQGESEPIDEDAADYPDSVSQRHLQHRRFRPTRLCGKVDQRLAIRRDTASVN